VGEICVERPLVKFVSDRFRVRASAGQASWGDDASSLSTVALTMIAFDQARLAEPPLDLQTFAERLSELEEHDPTGKRESQRFQMTTLVPAVLIDEQLEPLGEPFMVMTRNISTSGIALVHTAPINHGRVAIELTGASGERIQLALQILRCRELDKFYEMGCRYLRRLGTFTS
jgi:hypothetical protein